MPFFQRRFSPLLPPGRNHANDGFVFAQSASLKIPSWVFWAPFALPFLSPRTVFNNGLSYGFRRPIDTLPGNIVGQGKGHENLSGIKRLCGKRLANYRLRVDDCRVVNKGLLRMNGGIGTRKIGPGSLRWPATCEQSESSSSSPVHIKCKPVPLFAPMTQPPHASTT